MYDSQKNPSQKQLLTLLTEVVKQNNQLINHLQVQTNLNNELLLTLEEQEEPNSHEYMDPVSMPKATTIASRLDAIHTQAT